MTGQGQRHGSWLAKHARLLAELRLEVLDEQEQYVAAGLLAAAQPQPQLLLLRSLSLATSSTGAWSNNASGMRLLPSLPAACPQLTHLQLNGWFLGKGQYQQLATAFTALCHLQELSVELPWQMTLPMLQLGTQLTKLRLSNIFLPAEGFSSLSASLVDLAYQPDSRPALPAAGHLTALTRLECLDVDAGSNVPPSAQHLELRWCSDPAQLHHLTRLQSLDCGLTRCSLEQLQAAVVAIGPSLTALDIVAFGALRSALLSQRVSGPSLPLIGLTVARYGNISVAHLGQWSGLTRLSLQSAKLQETPQQVAEQLRQLTALQAMVLSDVPFSAPQAWQPVVECVVGMRSLRSLEIFPGLGAQHCAQLRGMTQLVKLVVYEASGKACVVCLGGPARCANFPRLVVRAASRSAAGGLLRLYVCVRPGEQLKFRLVCLRVVDGL